MRGGFVVLSARQKHLARETRGEIAVRHAHFTRAHPESGYRDPQTTKGYSVYFKEKTWHLQTRGTSEIAYSRLTVNVSTHAWLFLRGG